MVHNRTASFVDFHKRALAGQTLNVVFLGGSLTWGANASDPNQTSYRALMGKYLQQKYPKAHIINHDAAIGGTGSDLGLFRLQRDVLSHDPDLVFMDFTINDGITTSSDWRLNTYESLLQEMVRRGIAVMQVFLSCYDQLGEHYDLLKVPRYAAHHELARAYHSGVGDTLQYLQKLYDEKQIDMEALWCIDQDKTHPDDAGYRHYFEAVRQGYEQAVAQDRVCVLPQMPVFGPYMVDIRRTVLVDLPQIPEGWIRQKTFRTSMWFDGLPSRWMTDTLVADVKHRKTIKPLEFSFEGTMVGLFGEMDENTLPFRAWIDGQAVLNKGSEFWEVNTRHLGNGRLFFWTVIRHDLTHGRHTLKIEPLFFNSVKKGDLRIESICTAPAPAPGSFS